MLVLVLVLVLVLLLVLVLVLVQMLVLVTGGVLNNSSYILAAGWYYCLASTFEYFNHIYKKKME